MTSPGIGSKPFKKFINHWGGMSRSILITCRVFIGELFFGCEHFEVTSSQFLLGFFFPLELWVNVPPLQELIRLKM
jgi:hypothetical protein